MRTGESVRAARGFTYLWLLFVIAIGGAALSSLGPAWQQTMWREQEIESMHRGREIAEALARWRRATPGSAPTLAGPMDWQELLDDRRGPATKRHLRRLYTDPLTGHPDWVALRDATGAIVGLHSRATRPAILLEGIDASLQAGSLSVASRIYRPPSVEQAAAAGPT